MKNTFRIVTWNCNRATTVRGVWDYLLEIDPDVALLQEVGSIPEKVLTVYDCQMHQATTKTGSLQEFSTAILVKGRICNTLPLPSPATWIEKELQRFSGNLVAREIQPNIGLPIKAVSVYSPAWPLDRKWLSGIDVTGVRLVHSREVWVMDILWASLKHQRQNLDQPWIIAGDFNTSETFDDEHPKPRGNREFLERMAGLGFIECLRQSKGILTPTFFNRRKGTFKDQIDHLFVSPILADRLITCDTGSPDRVFNSRLSDHLPIIANFRL